MSQPIESPDEFAPSDELIELLQTVVDGVPSPREHCRLEELIRGDSAARAFFVGYLQLHATLSHQAVNLAIESGGDREVASSPALVTMPDGSTRRDFTEPAASRPARLKRYFILASALAAILAVAFGLPQLLPEAERTSGDSATSFADASGGVEQVAASPISRPPAPVATLVSFDALQTDFRTTDASLVVGQIFHEDETLHIPAGKARISVGYGAEIAAEAPCQLTFVARDRVRLDEGTVVVDVAPWAKGFTVVTNEMDVVDLGTTFSVSASGGATVETKVLSGLVRAVPAKAAVGQQRSVLLSEGEGLFVDNLGNRRIFAQLPDEILSKLDFGRLAQYRPVELHNSGVGLATGDEDPHWRVVAGPSDTFEGPDFAQVCVPNERYLENDPAESQWVSIRNWEAANPDSVYTFQTTFHLVGYDLSTMRLFGRFLADNGVKEVRINDRAVPVESWLDEVPGQLFGSSQFRFVNLTKGLVEGENVIEIDVWNGGVHNLNHDERHVVANHMALRAEWYAFGRQAEPRAADN